MKRRRLVWVFVTALGCSQMLSLLTGAKTVSVCGAGACLTTDAEVIESGAFTTGGAARE